MSPRHPWSERPPRDSAAYKSVSESEYAVYARFFERSRVPLEVRAEPGDLNSPYWTRTKVSYARIVILQGTYDPELAPGDWVWRNRAADLENAQAAHTLLGVVLRDELVRRFPHVEGPRQQSAASDAAILLRTKLSVSPSPNPDARLDVDVVLAPPQAPRTFRFTSSAGIEFMGQTRNRNVALAATDLAFQAIASQEFLDYLVAVTKATPE